MAPSLNVALPRSPTSPRRARRLTLDWLLDVGSADAGHIGALVVTELVTNAVVHGDAPISLELARISGAVRISVFDAGTQLPQRRDPNRGMNAGGRGLEIVDRLASRWGSEPSAAGKVTWAEIDDAVPEAWRMAAPDPRV